MEKLLINDFLQKSKGHILLDVRSPAEYKHAHIPGAINLPLFTDEERKMVGIAYKQQSRQLAIKIGLDFFGPKMRKLVETVESLVDDRSQPAERKTTNGQQSSINIFLYCWRGGMRSAAVAWLLNVYGFNIYLLQGGYKSFRNYVLQTFHQTYTFRILGGYTGSGKTEVLKELSKGEAVIDLEGISSHKGSAFGSLHMPPQPSQEMFENVLSCELQSLSNKQTTISKKNVESGNTSFAIDHSRLAIWLEDESQRIGNLNIPPALWDAMRKAPIYFLEIPFDERHQHIVEEYGSYDKEKLSDAIVRISKRLGGLETKNALEYLEKDNIIECFRILLHYYDKRYSKGLQGRENLSTLLTKIECQSVTPSNAGLLHQLQTVT